MAQLPKADFLYHEPCDKCGSSDGNSVYSDGSKYCFVCTGYTRGDGQTPVSLNDHYSNQKERVLDHTLITDGVCADLLKRGISQATCEKYGYSKGKYNGRQCQIANYYDAAGELVAQKLRFPDKSFSILGDIKKALLYGAQLWGKGKKIVITEGEIDALSMAQVQGLQWPVVSIPNGAQAAKKALAKNLEYLAQFEEIILMFDMDDPGKKAAAECAEMLGPSRCKIAVLPLKDPNEMLMAGRSGELTKAMWDARPYKPDGVLYGSELLDLVLTEDSTSEAVPYPWSEIQNILHGIRRSEIVTFTAGTGVGKSAVVREITHWLGQQSNQNVGIIALEESTRRTALGLISIQANLPLHIPSVRADVSHDQMTGWFNETLGTGRYFLIDHFGSSDPDTIINRIRYLVTGCDCTYIVLDHLSIIVSGMEEGDERRIIDNLMTKFVELTRELDFGLILISHLKRPMGKGHENGAETSLSQLRGSAAIGQLSDSVVGVERNQQGDNPNISTLRVLKNRFSGETGIAGYLVYDGHTGRLTETSPDFAVVSDGPDTSEASPAPGEDF